MRTKRFPLALLLMSCLQPAQEGGPGGSGPGSEGYGQARLVLPEISPLPLAKGTALGTFTLDITAPDMTHMSFAFPLEGLGGKAIEINRIPAGKARLFTGKLLDEKKVVTHEGSATADILRGQTTDVRLVLRITNQGSARICVEIEGVPPPAECRKPADNLDVVGCWNLIEDSTMQVPMQFFSAPVNGAMGSIGKPGFTRTITTYKTSGPAISFIVVNAAGVKTVYEGNADPSGQKMNGKFTGADGVLRGEWWAFRNPAGCAVQNRSGCWQIQKTSMACVRSHGFMKLAQSGEALRGTLIFQRTYDIAGTANAKEAQFTAVSPSQQGADSLQFIEAPSPNPQTLSGKYFSFNRDETGVWEATADASCQFKAVPDEKVCPGDVAPAGR